MEVNGLPVDAEIAAMLSVVYAVDGRWRVFFKSIPVAEGESSNDPSTSPKSFEMQTRGPPDGSRVGDRYVGIYEADDMLDRPLGEIRRELEIDTSRLRGYYARERQAVPGTLASLRLPEEASRDTAPDSRKAVTAARA